MMRQHRVAAVYKYSSALHMHSTVGPARGTSECQQQDREESSQTHTGPRPTCGATKRRERETPRWPER